MSEAEAAEVNLAVRILLFQPRRDLVGVISEANMVCSWVTVGFPAAPTAIHENAREALLQVCLRQLRDDGSFCVALQPVQDDHNGCLLVSCLCLFTSEVLRGELCDIEVYIWGLVGLRYCLEVADWGGTDAHLRGRACADDGLPVPTSLGTPAKPAFRDPERGRLVARHHIFARLGVSVRWTGEPTMFA